MSTGKYNCGIAFNSPRSFEFYLEDLSAAIAEGGWRYCLWDCYYNLVELRVKETSLGDPDLRKDYAKLHNFLCNRGFRQDVNKLGGIIYYEP